MIPSRSRQAGLTTLEWVCLALTLAVGGGLVVYMHLESEQKVRYMETVSAPLMQALAAYRTVNKS